MNALAIKITFGNFKGGVGKTTSSCMMSVLLRDRGYKVLHVDLDPQADSTEFLANTFRIKLSPDYNTLYDKMTKNLTANECVINLKENLDIIPSGVDVQGFPNMLAKLTKGKPRGSDYFYIDSVISELEENYDFIVFDVPPAQSELGYNALVASDYVVPVLQTQSKAYKQTKRYIEFVNNVREIMELPSFQYPPVEILGVLPYLQKKSSAIDKSIIKQASEQYGEMLFKSPILERERVKRYDEEGINFDEMDMHDQDVFKIYNAVLDELLERCGVNEKKQSVQPV